MKKLIKYTALIFMAISIFSCREVYYPEDIESIEKIPVIEGTIMEGMTPSVKLYWAINYEDDFVEYIPNAQVYVVDNFGSIIECYESWTGHYSGYEATTTGRTYTLKIRLEDGREYESVPQLLQPAPQIDSIYAIPGKYASYVYGSSGKPVFTNMEGLFIKTDLSTETPNTLYYRFNTSVIKLSVYTINLNTPASYSVYMWETSNMDNAYTVDHSATLDNFQVLYKHANGFLRYYYDFSLQTETRTAPYTDAWVVKQNVWSISADVYQYYKSIGNQLSGNNQIFAPVASQVRSNIFCTSDPREKVIGVFQANALATKYRAFGWRGLTSYRSKDLDSYPDVGNGSQDRFPPSFWIYFY